MGTVNLITVVYFCSSGNFPIYDYFAHRAVKTLSLGKAPCDVFVGTAPDKREIDKVNAMYLEYCHLTENAFGRKNIERELDRALWVYGHATKHYMD